MTSRPQTADYAAVGVGPVLIFLMISSLANFFVMLFYQGGYPDRIFYLILMYTMGSVALARLVIEEDRAYSAGYAIALGAAMLFVMNRFLGAPLITAGLVLLIGYLSDRIVHDCTLIDESVDSSGEGLIDRGLDEAGRLSERVSSDGAPDGLALSEKEKRRKKSHQPGRTVFLLALAALPLFGLGQFMLQNNPGIWARAQLMLGLYLFSSLSLLVTTSFLNLRRYLRQRDVDMPGDVTVAWLAGGVALIAGLLMLAFIAPLPGKALANIAVPKFLTSDEQTASSRGWGKEGADKSENDSDAETNRDPAPGKKDQKGAGINQNSPSKKGEGKKSGHSSPASSSPASSSPASSSPASSSPASSSPASSSPASSSPASNSPASNSPASNSPASNSQASNSQASNSQASNSQASNSQASNSQASNSQASNSQASNSQASNSQASNSQASNSQASNSQASNSQASNSQASNSQASNSQASNSQASNSQAKMKLNLLLAMKNPDLLPSKRTTKNLRSRDRSRKNARRNPINVSNLIRPPVRRRRQACHRCPAYWDSLVV